MIIENNKEKLVSGKTQGLGYNTSAVSIVSTTGKTTTLTDFAARNTNSVVFAGNISLASGTSTFADSATISFDMGTANAGQQITMIHFTSTGLQTAVGIADADSVVSFTVNSISPFILLKGEYTVTETQPTTDTSTAPSEQNGDNGAADTGDSFNIGVYLTVMLISAVAFTVALTSKKRKIKVG